MSAVWEDDIVVPKGKMMFKDDVELYSLDDFWRKGVYFSDVSQKQP
mgnify:CR=1 FL=1